MPDLARLFIKTALAYLAGALLVGIALTPPAVRWAPALAAVGPAQVHLLVVGWLTQLIFGVAYWLFPRPSREAPYGDARPARWGFVLLNAGLLLRVVAEPAQGWRPAPVWTWGLAVAAVLQWLAGVLVAAYLWTRVKAR
jgi:hypothetical protein